MNYIDDLQKTIDYIEENIKKPITIEECAKVAGFSKYYFYRLFTLFIGVPLMEYVRKRRLAFAMQEVNQGKRILDIALEYEYNSERAFCRAFLKEYGESPSKFRNKSYAIPEKPILERNEMIILGGRSMEYSFSEVKIIRLETMNVASSYVISDSPEGDVINYMTEWMEKNNIDNHARQFGFDIPVTEEQSQKGLRGYEYWVELNGDIFKSDTVKLKRIEECEYAVLRITNPFSNPFEVIPEGWKMLMQWVNDNGYMPGCDNNQNKSERYWLEEKIIEGDNVYLDLYFPIA